jgi:hypothetical protein
MEVGVYFTLDSLDVLAEELPVLLRITALLMACKRQLDAVDIWLFTSGSDIILDNSVPLAGDANHQCNGDEHDEKHRSENVVGLHVPHFARQIALQCQHHLHHYK